jgi:hypothetical protein
LLAADLRKVMTSPVNSYRHAILHQAVNAIHLVRRSRRVGRAEGKLGAFEDLFLPLHVALGRSCFLEGVLANTIDLSHLRQLEPQH